MTDKLKQPPESIYLISAGIGNSPEYFWCKDDFNNKGLEYVRSDKYKALTAQLEAALGANEVNKPTELSKVEIKEITKLWAATSGLIGYLKGLEESLIDSYRETLQNCYIKELKIAVKVFVDKIGE